MKIINKTQNEIYYEVTPSGTVLSGSEIIASGTVKVGNSLSFPLTDAGQKPIVYVKSAEPYNQGYLSIQVKDGDSSVEVSMTEI